MLLNLNGRFEADLDGTGPLGVAVSGGGDSVALLYALHAWRKLTENGRPLEVFCVDHGLNPASPAWTQGVADHATRLGVGFTALHWVGPKPQTGISAAARLARHALLAEAAREKGVRTLCLGHTRDDLAEAVLMQAEGSNVGQPRRWSPSPVWPEGRGIVLYRPCLDVRRETLREYLRGLGVGWIDDPSNESATSLRALARKDLARKALSGHALPENGPESGRLDLAQLHQLLAEQALASAGQITLRADVFQALPPETALTGLLAAMVCAGGGDRLPRREKLAALYAQLAAGKPATLCGARVQQTDGFIQIVRETGEFRRRGLPHLALSADEAGVWDGRFALTATDACEIIPACGVRSGLGDADQAALLALPAVLRDSQPLAIVENENIKQKKRLANNIPLRQSDYTDVKCACLVLARFVHAVGQVTCESDHRRLDELSGSETL